MLDHTKKWPNKKSLFLDERVRIGFNIVKYPHYGSPNLQKIEYNIKFEKGRVERFVNELLEIETYMKLYFEKKIELKLTTVLVDCKERNSCWLCEKHFKIEEGKKNLVVEDRCHSTGKFKELANDKRNLSVRKTDC